MMTMRALCSLLRTSRIYYISFNIIDMLYPILDAESSESVQQKPVIQTPIHPLIHFFPLIL